jgi:hypothetical protein
MWLLLGCVHVHTSGACKTLITRLARDVNANVGDDIRYDDDTVDESSDDSVSSNAVSSAVRFVRSYTSKRRIHQKGSNVFNYLYTKTMTELSRISLLKNHVSYRQIQQDYWK